MSFSAFYSRRRSAATLSSLQKLVQHLETLDGFASAIPRESFKSAFLSLKAPQKDLDTPRAFALAREACYRALGMRPFPVQLIGGLALLQGKVAEMGTGEGKTLTIVPAAAAAALTGAHVHVVTANQYLAKRDAELMRAAYEYLGLTVSYIDGDMSPEEKARAYRCDVVYGVGHEFGFDYLKDNLAKTASGKVQPPLANSVAIVDEVDSILIDEARVPMIISKTGPDVSAGVLLIDTVASELLADVHFLADLKERNASLTEEGYEKAESRLAELGLIEPGQLYHSKNLGWARRLHSAVKAYALFRKDKDYVTAEGEIVLVDAGTGRKMPGRRLDDGLHEALEAKERLKVRPGTMTAATITYQNYFGLYQRIGGLTGTAMTDAEEFSDIYGMDVVAIPPNRPRQRTHLADTVFLTKEEKFKAVVAEVVERSSAGQPVLVGCASIRDAEVLEKLLNAAGVRPEVLTAKHLAQEAHIIANAGRLGAVTVATNIAGRGTDIALGGEKPERAQFDSVQAYEAAMTDWRAVEADVITRGGLYVLGTERNGLRRVDNQLAGRSGRQGNPGTVHFMLSMEDELLKVFGQASHLSSVKKGLAASGAALSGTTVTRFVTQAQKRVENQGFDARKQLMKYDSVLAEQRAVLYDLRDQLLNGAPGTAETLTRAAVHNALERMMEPCDQSYWADTEAVRALEQALADELGVKVPLVQLHLTDELDEAALRQRVFSAGEEVVKSTTPENNELIGLFLGIIDNQWSEHLTVLDELKQSAGLKGHSGQNPLYQFTKESLAHFQALLGSISHEVARNVLNPQVRMDLAASLSKQEAEVEAVKKVSEVFAKRWILRSERCPCQSGELFKNCHGSLNR